MPINNITQTVSTIPAPPHRGVDVQTQFVIKQEDFQDHLQGTTVAELNTLKDQLNLRIGEINSTATTMNGYADTASAGASTATTKAGEASSSASDALASRNQAETFKNNASASATKASQWADYNYNVEVEAGKYSAKHWSTVAQNATANKIDKDFSILTDKATPTDTDIFAIRESGGLLKKLNWGNIKTTLKTYFDTLYMALTGNQTIAGNKNFTGNLLMTGASSVTGYGTGSGGVVTQLTNKNFNVTLNKPTGTIITSNSTLVSGQITYFNFLNSLISINDTLIIIPKGSINYDIDVIDIYNGAASIRITNRDSISRSDAIAINFAVIKGANS